MTVTGISRPPRLSPVYVGASVHEREPKYGTPKPQHSRGTRTFGCLLYPRRGQLHLEVAAACPLLPDYMPLYEL